MQIIAPDDYEFYFDEEEKEILTQTATLLNEVIEELREHDCEMIMDCCGNYFNENALAKIRDELQILREYDVMC